MDDDLKKIIESATLTIDEEKLQAMVQEKLSEAMERSSTHFGQPYFNTATVAGVYRMLLKDIAEELGVEFPVKDEGEVRKQPWWWGMGI